MRIIFMGQQAFGKAALDKLIEAGTDEIVAVFCAPDKGDRIDPVKQTALDQGLPHYQPASYKDEATLQQLRDLNADLMIMAFVIIFIPEAARDIPKMGSICFHPSLLPLHRGPSAINWAILHGRTETGLSWFYPTDGLDEGEILLQWKCDIGPDETLGDVYFKKIFPAGVDSVLQVADLYRSGNPPRNVQDESQATYESWCKKPDVALDWSAPVAENYNKIRAGSPQPGAWTTLNGDEVQVFDSRRADGDGAAGAVTAIGDDGVTVQAAGGRIRMIRVRPKGGDKQAAQDWAAAVGLSVGDTMGS